MGRQNEPNPEPEEGRELHADTESNILSVIIAQWENECVSVSVLSMGWVMIAQWENECISVSALSMAWVMIAQ